MMAKKAGGNYYPFACVENVQLKTQAGMLETTTIGSGNWREKVYDKKLSWTAGLGGVMILEDVMDNAWTLGEIHAAQLAFTKLEVKFFFIDTNNRMLTYTGTALMPDVDLTAQLSDGGELGKWALQLEGTGALVKGGVEDKVAYILYEDGGRQLLEDDSGGAVRMEG